MTGMASEPKPRLTIELPQDVYQHVAVLARRLGISVERMAAQTVSEAAERGMYVMEEMDWEMGQRVARDLTDEDGRPRPDLFPASP